MSRVACCIVKADVTAADRAAYQEREPTLLNNTLPEEDTRHRARFQLGAELRGHPHAQAEPEHA